MINTQLRPPLYDPEAVQPMRDELIYVGFEELTTPQMVQDEISLKDDKIRLVVINSVCGCAAGQARPGVRLALEGGVRPDRLVTVFAGQEVEATKQARGYFADIPPSSPSMALFKDGELVYFVPRHRIESRSAQEVAADLTAAFERYFAPAATG